MNCPENRGRYPFEGGDGCRADCGKAVWTGNGYACAHAAAAVALLVIAGIVDKDAVRLNVETEADSR